MMSFRTTCGMLCFSYVNPVFKKIFHVFLYFISSRANVGKLIIVICSLLLGVDFVADELNLEWKLHFLEKKKHALLYPIQSPER